MERFASDSRTPECPADQAHSHRRRGAFGHAALVRLAAAGAVGLYFLAAALSDDDPLAMVVGLFPIAWIGVELVWVALRPHDRAEDD